MKKAVKWVLLIIIAAACVVGGIYYATLPLVVSVTKISPRTAELYFLEQGVTKTERVAELFATASGKIVSINTAENAVIKEGDVICEIDASGIAYEVLQAESRIKGYEAQALGLRTDEEKQKEALVANKNALLGELKSTEAQEAASGATMTEQSKLREEQLRLQRIVITQNETDLERAQEDLRKTEILFGAGAVPANDLEEVRKLVEKQKNLLEQNKQQMTLIENGQTQQSMAEYYKGLKASLNAQIAGIDESLAKSYTAAMNDYYNAQIQGERVNISRLKKSEEDLKIRSNVSGVVKTLDIKDVNTVAAGALVATVVADATNKIEVFVTTNDIDEVAVGDKVDLILKRRSGDKVFEGRVGAIGDEAVVKISALGVEERRVKVTVTPVTGADEIKPGYDTDVKFYVYHEENKLLVPKTAVFKVDGGDYVWVVKGDGVLEMVEVKKGPELRTDYVVESGIADGELVVTDSDKAGLKAGGKVRTEF